MRPLDRRHFNFALAAASGLVLSRSAAATPPGTFEVARSDAEWQRLLTPAQYAVLRKSKTERAGSSPLDGEKRAGTYHCAGWLAELLEAARRRDRHAPGDGLVHVADRSALPPLRRPSRPRLQRRPQADRAALLHERRGHDLQTLGSPFVKTLAAVAFALVALWLVPANAQNRAVAIFAGGCFWCMEPPFDKLDGVLSTTSGYIGGTKADPTYEQVTAGRTGHYEAVQIEYDPARIGYDKLLEVFWRNIDPVDPTGQFCDKGPQYRSAIFALDEEQRKLAEASKTALDKSGKLPSRVVTEILPAAKFYAAEDYHQDYYRKNPGRYTFYRWNCGRDGRLQQLWGKPS
jgi:peptide-methionine (S)-S-oxide reductase